MVVTTPALLLVRGNGTVLEENDAAEQLLGDGRGRSCWEFMSGQPDAADLPCTAGCVGRLLESSHRAKRTQVQVNGADLELTCIAAGEDRVACVLHSTKQAESTSQESLTPREHQVLERIAEGRRTADIALQLGIREATVRSYIEQMRNKLGTPTRACLVARALRLGLLK